MIPRGAKPLAQVLIMDGPKKLKIHQKRKEDKKLFLLFLIIRHFVKAK